MTARVLTVLAAISLLLAGAPEGVSEARQRPLFADVPGHAFEDRVPQPNDTSAQMHQPGGGGQRSTDIRQRRVKVDVSSIDGAGHPEGVASIGLNLFPDVDLTAVKQRFERRGAGRSTWVGKVEDDPAGSVILVEVEGLVAGSVYAHGKHFAIRGTSAESQEVVEIDQSAFPPEACDQQPAADQAQATSAPSTLGAAPADAGPVIGVMVVYTPAARTRQGGRAAIEATIETLVAETNVSYANSGIPARLNLVHTAQVNYTETRSPTGYTTDLARLRNPNDGFMDGVHTWRNQFAADVVVLLVDAESNYPLICGYSNVISATASSAFALVGEKCGPGSYVFAHEIGHLQGARHDRYVDPVDGPNYPYNHGDVDLVSRQRTVMAYNNECRDKLKKLTDTDPRYCERLPYWSNPDLFYPASPYYSGTPHPMGTLTSENNTLVLASTATNLAGFRQTLTVQSAYPASGVSIAVEPAALSGGGAPTPFTLVYGSGVTVTLTAPPTEPLTGNPLQGWSGCTSEIGNVCTVTLAGDATVTANYFTNNYLPTLDAISNLTINEDAGPQTVSLAGISAGEGENQNLVVTASSDNPGLIPGPSVDYTSPATTGSLSFTPTANVSGAATITVTVDDGQATYSTIKRTFQVTVTPVNDAPSFVKGTDLLLLEDAGPQTVTGWATGISAGPADESAQTLTFATTNDNNPLFSVQPAVATNGTLTFTPAPNANGTATVTLRLRDSGGTANGGVDTSPPQTFAITVTAVNDPPSFVKGPNRTVLEDAGARTVANWATGVRAGPANESGQELTFTTTNNNNLLFSVQPAVAGDGTLTFTPAPDASGTATVTVQLRDNGGTENGGSDASATRMFTITVAAVNDRPTLADPPDMTIAEDAGQQTVFLTGISAGGGEFQRLRVTAISSNTALIPTPTVNYASPNATGSLFFTPLRNASGSAIITVRVGDGQTVNSSVAQTFLVTVNAVNDVPTLNQIVDRVLKENAGLQTVSLNGITAGPKERQGLTVTARSSNTALIPNPTVIYTSPNTTGSLRFTPAPNAYGSATITVTVDDGQTENNLIERSFLVTVNNRPTLAAIADRTVNEDAGVQVVALSGISAGGGENQAIAVTAGSSNRALIPDPAVSYSSPDTTGSLSFAPSPNRFGSATITVTVSDGQAGNNTFKRTFLVTVKAVNDPPTLAAIPDLLLDAGAGLQTVPLAGITAGPGESQALTVTARSSNTALIPNPTVSYTSPSTTGSLRFRPVAGASGEATITVTVRDGQATNNSFARTFLVTVNSTTNGVVSAMAGSAALQAVSASFVGIVGGTAYEDPSGPAPLAVTFDAGASTGPNPIVAWRWDFGDGETRETAAEIVTHDYTATGSYVVTLTVTDALGERGATQRLVSVADEIRTATSPAELQSALTAAGANGLHDIIRLAGGVYTLSANGGERFLYSSAESGDLVIEGGWTPDFSQRAANIPTRLVGDVPAPLPGLGGVLEIAAGGGVTLDGLEISGGAAEGNGGGVAIGASGTIAVRNCQVLENTSGGEGGGLYLESAAGEVRVYGNLIRGNSGASGGGGAIRAASAGVRANEISINSATVADGGLVATVSSGGNLAVSNNTISGNTSPAGASGLAVAAVGTAGVSRLALSNNIVYGNGAAPGLAVAADCDYLANHLDVIIANNDIESYAICPDVQLDLSNISVHFSGCAAGDIRLSTADAALVDKGAAIDLPPADFEGDLLPLDGDGDGAAVPDIGADEYNPGNITGPAALTASVDGNIATAGGSAMVTVTLDAPAKQDLVFYLDSGDTAVVIVPAPYLRILRGQSAGQLPVQAAPGASYGAATITAIDPGGRIASASAVVTVSGGN